MDVKKLMQSMTVRQKANQLLQLNAVVMDADAGADTTGPRENLGMTQHDVDNVGSVLNWLGAERMKRIQKNFLARCDVKIPLLFMLDVIHGYRTNYPINLGLACAFDMDLQKECAAMAAKEAALNGVHVTFAPMLDLARDARWGRVMETSGEDPFLNAQIAKAVVEGFQGDMGKYNVAACVKHYAAYGATEDGKDYNTVDMSERTLREYYLPAYRAAVDAGAKLVMTAFNILDGIPAIANTKLVRQILRKEWGFDGIIVSDFNAFREMITHGYAENEEKAAEIAMNNTIDLEMMSATYLQHIEKLIADGKVTEAQLDAAVEKTLRLKEELGLFDNPFRVADEAESEKYVLCAEHRSIARRAAEDSAVLLKNDGVLPLGKSVKRIAVLGPHADNGEIDGNWMCVAQSEDTVTVYDGIRAKLPDARVVTAAGVGLDIDGADESGIPAAVRLAKESDAVVLCLGEAQLDSGEGNSKQFLDLPAAQYKLLDEVLKVNRNVAVLLFTGRPLAVKRLADTAPAILNMWFPGTEGGSAAANLLFGDAVPAGKLTMTFPYSVGQCPIYYNHYNTGRPRRDDTVRKGYCSSYIDGPNAPLYPFGYGLSYTTFNYSGLKLSADSFRRGEKLTVSVTVTNTGAVAGRETVQMYIRDWFGSTVRPVRELKGFEKVALAPGESQTVTFTVEEDLLAFYGADLVRKAETGEFTVYVGGDSTCELSADFKLKE